MAAHEHQLRIRELPGQFAVCRLAPNTSIPEWATSGELTSITRTREELSIVCAEDRVPAGTRCERGYSALRVEGPLAPEMVGVLVSLATPLAGAGIPILAIGTYDTDYVLVRATDLERARDALQRAGHDLAASY
jgi:hypothetical protein